MQYMDNDVCKLPEDLISSQQDEALHIYRGNSLINKTKVQFTQNLLCILVEGEKTVYRSNISQDINNNQFFLLSAKNTIMVDKPTTDGFKSILLFFSNDYLLDFCFRYKISLSNINSFKNDLFIFDKDAYIVNYQNTLISLNQFYLSNNEFSKLKIDEIFSYLLLLYPEKVRNFFSKCLYFQTQTSFMSIIDKYKYTHISIQELAFLCNMSISTFNRQFSSMFKDSPKRYFMRYQMEKAQQLLLLGKTASEVCDELKYHNLSAFSRQFKKYFGASPKKYKK